MQYLRKHNTLHIATPQPEHTVLLSFLCLYAKQTLHCLMTFNGKYIPFQEFQFHPVHSQLDPSPAVICRVVVSVADVEVCDPSTALSFSSSLCANYVIF
jgi:hypothetical protein